jgi:predicted ribosome quality control (RQC) complex YloA/Tae2 family protein
MPMRIKVDINKTVEANAAVYFEKAKKSKRKLEGAKKALDESIKKLELLKKEKPKEKEAEARQLKKEWYEKFRWFMSSEGFLCIGGRDATTNEIIIKKYAEENDLVFHTDIAGSPFFVIKAEGKKPGEQTIKETSQATATFSRAWKLGLGSVDVFHVKPEQVTKEAKSGEYLTKGAFMIYGKKEYINSNLSLAVGVSKGKICAGPAEAIKKNSEKFVMLERGQERASSIAKYIQRQIGGEIDDIIRVLPAGEFKIKK